jgi:lipopolysaccharide export LptBFGC system permease protein LptF
MDFLKNISLPLCKFCFMSAVITMYTYMCSVWVPPYIHIYMHTYIQEKKGGKDETTNSNNLQQ